MGRHAAWQLCALLLLLSVISTANTARLPRKRDKMEGWVQKRPVDNEVWVETVSWFPRAFVYHHFLTAEECEHLITLGKPTMVKSSVIDNETGKSVDSRVRTSSGTFLNRDHDEVVRRIEDRIARFSKIPFDNGESLQILHYEPSQKYEPHFDYFHDPINAQNGGQRLATMLMYLSDVEEGGETVFPNSQEKPHVGNPSYSTCGQQGVAVKPRAGDALLFYSQTPNGTLDTLSLHSGCPVIRGNKWSATKWMRVNTFHL